MQRINVGLLATTIAVVFISGTAQSVIQTDVVSVDGGEAAEAERIALNHLRATVLNDTAAFTGMRTAEPDEIELRVDSTARSEGVTHVYVQQQVDGVDLIDGTANVAVTDDGEVAYAPAQLIPSSLVSEAPSAALPLTVNAIDAVELALEAAAVEPTQPLRIVEAPTGSDQRQKVSDGGVNARPFDVALIYTEVDGELRLGWNVELEVAGVAHGRTVVAIDDSSVLRTDHYRVSHGPDAYDNLREFNDRNDRSVAGGAAPLETPASKRTATADTSTSWNTRLSTRLSTRLTTDDGSSYSVFPIPVEAPSFGSQQVVSQPADALASPYGWHDTDGKAGAESTTTEGNNVISVLDLNANDSADANSQPDGGLTLQFNSMFDGSSSPLNGENPNAAVTQAFYTSNWAHDFFYAYGFDENAGNFQVNNYGRGGSEDDPVIVDSLDGYELAEGPYTRNNAFFTTPPDGYPGRMDLTVFTLTNPQRSSSFDNGVIIHEYAHGWSVRLTGGRNNVNCLSNAEQMGEGWSDFAALMATTRVTDTGDERRGIGSWVLGQPTAGGGVREFPYSSDGSADPRTYASVATEDSVHGIGSVWASMLWDLNWALISEYGFDPDLLHGNGGNNITMQLVSDGLKLQPCSPGFVDGRDAILEADQIAHAGAHECLIWAVFANRGLGWFADQGSSDNSRDGVASFQLAPQCSPMEPLWAHGNLANAERLGSPR